MTMPSSGPLNMGGTSSPVSVAQELGLSLTATITMNQTNVRTLAGVSTTSGTSWSMSSLYGKTNGYAIEYLVVGGGGAASSGGGGAGGYVATTGIMAPGGSYAVVVGAGGSPFGTSTGSNSSFNSSVGGGGNSTSSSDTSPPFSGGSGAGSIATAFNFPANTRTSFLGGGVGTTNRGGNYIEASPSSRGRGGGGGAGAAGNQGYANTYYAGGGAGGAGSQWLNGTYYGGGGGGFGQTQTYCVAYAAQGGAGGIGGGGQGGYYYFENTACANEYAAGSPGTANRGGGGGDGYGVGAGGSGIVIIRYPGAQRGSGGTVTSSGGYTYHTFNSSGTYTA